MAEFVRDAAGATEAQQKQALAYLFDQASVGLAATGVLVGLGVSQTTSASGSVVIAAGGAVVQASVLDGASLLVNNTARTLDVLTANPVGGLPRNDVVVFDSVTKAVAVIVGTPNAVPTDPTVPASACALARLRHAASATTVPTAKIDDLRVRTSLRGAGITSHPDTATGGTLGANVTAGITSGVTIAAAPYERVIRGGFGAQPAAGSGELQVYRDGAPIRKAGGLAVDVPRSGTYVFTLAAGVSTALSLVVAAGASGCNVSTDATYVYHNVTSEAAR